MPHCNGCLADDDYDDFGYFIFKAHFENFLEYLDSPTQEVNSRTPHCLSNETSLNVLSFFGGGPLFGHEERTRTDEERTEWGILGSRMFGISDSLS